ncbi:MAG TPA: glycosyltransferase, partial [Vicinamibacterales bacterium]|nr:glycosyltransferase [Vicinamibacterales bacterium]
MRVLVVVHGLPPHAQGGSEIYAESVARELRRRHGDDVLILTRENDVSRDDDAVRTEDRDGLRIVWINNTFRRLATFAESYANPRIDAVASRVIDEFKPDVAHLHHLTCLSTTIVDRLAERGVPICYTLHDYWLLCHRGQLLDTELRPCDGPEPAGCRSCLGLPAGAPAGVRQAAAGFKAIEGKLPRPMASALRGFGTRVATRVANAEQGRDEARARLDHMRALAARVPMFLAPSQSMHDRFRAFGVDAGRIVVHRYGVDPSPFRGLTRAASAALRIGFIGSL